MHSSKNPDTKSEVSNLEDMLKAELEAVRRRRGTNYQGPLLGLAMSGGGVRSGTVSLGFLDALLGDNHLADFDYISTVSGGSYASGYLYSAIEAFEKSGNGAHEALFGNGARDQLQKTGWYLALGTGLVRFYGMARLGAAFLFTLFINLLWIPCAFIFATMLASLTHLLVSSERVVNVALTAIIVTAIFPALGRLVVLPALQGLSLLARWLGKKCASTWLSSLGRSASISALKTTNAVEVFALLVVVVAMAIVALIKTGDAGVRLIAAISGQPASIDNVPYWVVGGIFGAIISLLILALADSWGLFSFFRNLIDSSYCAAGRSAASRNAASGTHSPRWPKNRLTLFDLQGKLLNQREARLPYPLFNAATYFMPDTNKGIEHGTQKKIGRGGKKNPRVKPESNRAISPFFSGNSGALESAPAYFLLSPMFCGTKESGYRRLGRGDNHYDNLIIADAVAASAASLSPLMYGHASLPVRLAFMFFNLNLAAWFPHPSPQERRFLSCLYPSRYFSMLRGGSNVSGAGLLVADGAFADNLAVMELLRRRCELIVCVDSTFDPTYEFHDLRRLVSRASAELSLQIDVGDALELLMPNPLTGYSKKQLAVLTVSFAPSALSPDEKGWTGKIVYLKATRVAPLAKLCRAQGPKQYTGTYDAYFSKFPQESTGDQFFDPHQWDAYNELGKQLAHGLSDEAKGSGSSFREKLLSRSRV